MEEKSNFIEQPVHQLKALVHGSRKNAKNRQSSLRCCSQHLECLDSMAQKEEEEEDRRWRNITATRESSTESWNTSKFQGADHQFKTMQSQRRNKKKKNGTNGAKNSAQCTAAGANEESGASSAASATEVHSGHVHGQHPC